MQDAILLYDSLLNSRQFQNPVELKIWIWMLLTAQKEEGFVPIKGKGNKTVKIKSGQLVFQRNTVALTLEIPGSTLMDIVKRMVFDGCITIETFANQYSVITLSNCSKFKQYTNGVKQDISVNPTTIRQPSDNHPTTKKKTDKEPVEHWNKLVDVWHSDYLKKKGEKPTITPKDAAALKSIVGNLKGRSEERGKDWTEETATGTLQHFLDFAYRDDWLVKNYLLPNLNSQFDKIITNAQSTYQSAATRNNTTVAAELAAKYASRISNGQH